MSQRRELEQRLEGQQEIGEILTSMKNLAYRETRKLDRLLQNQQLLVERIERIAEDFLCCHPGVLPPAESRQRTYLVVGSRRGLCGDFNARLMSALQQALASGGERDDLIIAVGRKLCQRLTDLPTRRVELEGSDVAEEIPRVMHEIVRELERRQRQSLGALIAFYHGEPPRGLERRQLLPPFSRPASAPPPAGFAPLLNLRPRQFLLGLTEQYLYAALHAVLYQSLAAENERRIRHLEGAVHHLEEHSAVLQRRIHALRQEEIIEEIEVILLNTAGLDQPGPMGE